MKHNKQIAYEITDKSSLDADEQALLDAAMIATETAYAPYSDFYVGAAIQLENGEIFIGNNQENRAYPSGMCAERTALYYVGALGRGAEIRKIAIRAKCKAFPVHKPVTPCGACRQAMLEYEEICGKSIIIMMMGEDGKVLRVEGVGESLMPFHFDADF